MLIDFTGEVMGLTDANSKTKVAVKTAKYDFDSSQRLTLLCEIKILSSLDLHLNLVNMVASCTSCLISSGKLWILLEFCEHGK